MPSELSKELNLAPSTIVEHLNILEEAGLIDRKDTGRKWIYYELTSKGEGLIAPKFPIQFVLVLSLGLIFMLSGIANIYSYPDFMAETQKSFDQRGTAGGAAFNTTNESAGAGGSVASTSSIPVLNIYAILLIAVGLALTLTGSYKILRIS